jgi:hypothetical protein
MSSIYFSDEKKDLSMSYNPYNSTIQGLLDPHTIDKNLEVPTNKNTFELLNQIQKKENNNNPNNFAFSKFNISDRTFQFQSNLGSNVNSSNYTFSVIKPASVRNSQDQNHEVNQKTNQKNKGLLMINDKGEEQHSVRSSKSKKGRFLNIDPKKFSRRSSKMSKTRSIKNNQTKIEINKKNESFKNSLESEIRFKKSLIQIDDKGKEINKSNTFSQLNNFLDCQEDNKSNCNFSLEKEKNNVKMRENKNIDNLTEYNYEKSSKPVTYSNNSPELRSKNAPSEVDKKKLLIQRRSLLSRKRISEMNQFAVTDILKKSDINSDYTNTLRTLKWLDFTISILITLNIFFSIIDNEISLYYSDSYINDLLSTKEKNYIITKSDLKSLETRSLTNFENFMRILNALLSIFCSCLIILHYKKKIILEKIERKLSKYDTLYTSGNFKYLAFDFIICMIFYPPFLNKVICGDVLGLIFVYNWNSIISIFVMSKIYFIFKIFKYFSRWLTDTAVAVCNNHNVKSGIHFAIKSEMKKRPGTILSSLLIISIIFFSFSIRTFEHKVFDAEHGFVGVKGTNDLQNLLNCSWLIVVTMTTVGYGDFYPRTHLGRFIGVLACIVGLLLLSLIIVFLGSVTEFSYEEKKAYSKLKKLFADDNVENKAANVIKSVFLLRRLNSDYKFRSPRNNLMQRFIYITRLKKEISIFKNDYKIANSYTVPVDEMLMRLETKLKDDILKLTGIIGELNGTDNDLDVLAIEQCVIQNNIDQVISMQNDISKYLINLNNEKYRDNLYKRRVEEQENERKMNLEMKRRKSVEVFEIPKKSGRKISVIKPVPGNNKKSIMFNLNTKRKSKSKISCTTKLIKQSSTIKFLEGRKESLEKQQNKESFDSDDIKLENVNFEKKVSMTKKSENPIATRSRLKSSILKKPIVPILKLNNKD